MSYDSFPIPDWAAEAKTASQQYADMTVELRRDSAKIVRVDGPFSAQSARFYVSQAGDSAVYLVVVDDVFGFPEGFTDTIEAARRKIGAARTLDEEPSKLVRHFEPAFRLHLPKIRGEGFADFNDEADTYETGEEVGMAELLAGLPRQVRLGFVEPGGKIHPLDILLHLNERFKEPAPPPAPVPPAPPLPAPPPPIILVPPPPPATPPGGMTVMRSLLWRSPSGGIIRENDHVPEDAYAYKLLLPTAERAKVSIASELAEARQWKYEPYEGDPKDVDDYVNEVLDRVEAAMRVLALDDELFPFASHVAVGLGAKFVPTAEWKESADKIVSEQPDKRSLPLRRLLHFFVKGTRVRSDEIGLLGAIASASAVPTWNAALTQNTLVPIDCFLHGLMRKFSADAADVPDWEGFWRRAVLSGKAADWALAANLDKLPGRYAAAALYGEAGPFRFLSSGYRGSEEAFAAYGELIDEGATLADYDEVFLSKRATFARFGGFSNEGRAAVADAEAAAKAKGWDEETGRNLTKSAMDSIFNEPSFLLRKSFPSGVWDAAWLEALLPVRLIEKPALFAHKTMGPLVEAAAVFFQGGRRMFETDALADPSADLWFAGGDPLAQGGPDSLEDAMEKILDRKDVVPFLQLVFFMPFASGGTVDMLATLPVDPNDQTLDVLRQLYGASLTRVDLRETFSKAGSPKEPLLAFFYIWALWKNFVEWKDDPSDPLNDEKVLLYSGGTSPSDKDVHGIRGAGSKLKREDAAEIAYPQAIGTGALGSNDAIFDWEVEPAEGGPKDEEEGDDTTPFGWETRGGDANDVASGAATIFRVPDVVQFEGALQAGNRGLAAAALEDLRDTTDEREAALAQEKIVELRDTYSAVISSWGGDVV